MHKKAKGELILSTSEKIESGNLVQFKDYWLRIAAKNKGTLFFTTESVTEKNGGEILTVKDSQGKISQLPIYFFEKAPSKGA